MKDIILTTINAKWIHPSLALRLLKANLGALEDRCEIIEFALRQPLCEKTEPLLAANPQILGISVSIWNHLATIELLKELNKSWTEETKPVVVLGGPEVSFLPFDAEIFYYADYVICGEGENAFRVLCETLLAEAGELTTRLLTQKFSKFIPAEPVNLSEIKSAYHLYSNDDLEKKLVYVEASRGCLFNCEFCLSAVKTENSEQKKENRVREFPVDMFLSEMDILIQRGVKTFKFLDRTFNSNIKRALYIMDFFLKKIEERKEAGQPLVVHFEMTASLFLPELLDKLRLFPSGSLRLEIGIQTLNKETASHIGRIINPEKELEALRFLREKTNAIIHVDLIAGLPGEDIISFGKGFDRLWTALCIEEAFPLPDNQAAFNSGHIEIQLGILKLLPGALISRHNDSFSMSYNKLPPYDIEESSSMSVDDLKRIKNFARFWEIIVNRGLIKITYKPVFNSFLDLSDKLFAHFGRNWGIDKSELLAFLSL